MRVDALGLLANKTVARIAEKVVSCGRPLVLLDDFWTAHSPQPKQLPNPHRKVIFYRSYHFNFEILWCKYLKHISKTNR